VNATELFAALAGLPGVRHVPAAANGVSESVLVSRVEIARAEAADERALRRTWRSRYGGGPDPLLLVADDPERPGALRALGPVAGDGPIRVVSADDLLPVLRRLTGLTGLQAPRELAEELDRLDRTGVAGLVVRGLGTEHLYRDRLRSRDARKIAVFATYGETIEYLHEKLPELVGGRERVTVIGSESSPDERTRLLSRFSPKTVVRPGYVPPDGEVDLLLSTDVLSEGQNLQQAQAVVSYDMPWNPQRVVQRNGRVIRLLSPHEEVFLTTMLPLPGELEELLRLETTIRAKIRAAGVYGMEVEVVEGIESELRQYAERLVEGDPSLAEEDGDEALSGAFLGEELRARVFRAQREGELRRIAGLPWGIGAVFRQTPEGRSRGPAGVFFATRTRPMPAAKHGYRYWRYVELQPLEGSEGLLDSDLEMLRRIDPVGSAQGELEGVDLEAAWLKAVADIVAEHNRRADPRSAQEAIGPAQRFGLELLRDPTVILPEGAERAAEALSVERSSAVRRALNEIQADVREERISRNEAAARIVELVNRLGLQPVALDDLPESIEVDDLGVVCWMAVLPALVTATGAG